MRMAMVVGAAVLFAPALALAQAAPAPMQNQPTQNQPSQMQNQRTQNQPSSTTTQNRQLGNQPEAQQAQGQTASNEDVTSKRLLPNDAKLIGTVESTDIRAFPEQMAMKGETTGKVEKEGVVGVGGLDRVWTTKQPYKQTVSQLDQKMKKEGIESLAKTKTQSATAWNVRMPDGHIANVVVRNTQPTTIEAVQAAVVTGSVTETGQPDRANTK